MSKFLLILKISKKQFDNKQFISVLVDSKHKQMFYGCWNLKFCGMIESMLGKALYVDDYPLNMYVAPNDTTSLISVFWIDMIFHFMIICYIICLFNIKNKTEQWQQEMFNCHKPNQKCLSYIFLSFVFRIQKMMKTCNHKFTIVAYHNHYWG